MSRNQKKNHGCDGREHLPEWLVKRLDFPPDVLCGGLRVEMRGRESLTVEGCRKILVYTPTLIKLKMHRCVLVIEGERLLCHAYLSGAVGLEGMVNCLHFEDEEG